MNPAQEFDGFYPPPYGPKTYSAGGNNTNAFPPEDVDQEKGAEDALCSFHLDRLKLFVDDLEINLVRVKYEDLNRPMIWYLFILLAVQIDDNHI